MSAFHVSMSAFPGPQVHQFPDSLSRARAVMMFNTAAVFCITRDLDKARKALQEVSHDSMALMNLCVVLTLTVMEGDSYTL